jgi:hypothetical protein
MDRNLFMTVLLVILAVPGAFLFRYLGASLKASLVAALGVSAGLLCLLGAVHNWEWLMTDERLLPFVERWGRTGMRLLYAIWGVAVLGGSAWLVWYSITGR